MQYVEPIFRLATIFGSVCTCRKWSTHPATSHPCGAVLVTKVCCQYSSLISHWQCDFCFPATTHSGTTLLGFTGGTEVVSVTLAGVDASVVNSNETHVVAAAGSGTGSGDIVLTSNTGAQAVQPGGWVYLPDGEINQVRVVHVAGVMPSFC